MANRNQKDRLLEHSYDGIQEYDNPMPRWWVISFWATIIFAAAYLANIGGLTQGKGRIAAYEADMAAFRLAHPEVRSVDLDALMAAVADPHEVTEGKAVFLKNCAACHVADGGGNIGPNLTDDYWIHGGTLEAIGTLVLNGVNAKGMPTWGKLLPPKELNEVIAYVWTLRGTTPAKPKAPQGDLVPR